jgi:cyclohexanecarboxyl-CoA dehydrogenase
MMPVPDPPVPTSPIRDEVDRAVEELRLAERAAELDRQPEFPKAEFRALGERGLLGLHTATRLGGRGLSLLDSAATLYRLAYRSGSTTFAKLSLQPEFSSVLAELGSDALVASYFVPLCRGERLIGNQVTEPAAGSDPRGMAFEALRDDRGYRLRGTKSQAAFAVDAEAAIVYARVPAHSAGPGGITAFLVPQDRPGIDRRLVPDLGERWMRRGAVRYENVPIGPEFRLGEEGKGLEYVLPELTRERALLAMIYLGVARRSLEETVEFVGQRETFGRPLSQQQSVSFPLVEDWSDADAATLYALRSIEKLSDGEEATAEAALSKWMATDVALTTLDHAIQFHGGRGYSTELPFERQWRDVRSGGIAHGPSELMHRAGARRLWPPPQKA